MHDLSYIVKANKAEAKRQLDAQTKRDQAARDRITRANEQKARILKGAKG